MIPSVWIAVGAFGYGYSREHLFQLVFVLVAPPVILGIFSTRAAERARRSHRWLYLALVLASSLALIIFGTAFFGYMIFASMMGYE